MSDFIWILSIWTFFILPILCAEANLWLGHNLNLSYLGLYLTFGFGSILIGVYCLFSKNVRRIGWHLILAPIVTVLLIIVLSLIR